MRRKLIGAFVGAILLVVVYTLPFVRHPPQVSGMLFPDELAAIKHVAHRELRHDFLEQVSLGIRHRNAALLGEGLIKLRPDYVLRDIAQRPDGTVDVRIGILGASSRGDVYSIQKTGKGWQVVGHHRWKSWPAARGETSSGVN